MNHVGRFMTLDQAGALMSAMKGTVLPVKLVAAKPTPTGQDEVDTVINRSYRAMECFVGLGNHPSVKLYGWRFCYDHGWMPV